MQGVSFERLPPERRIAAPTAASAGSCCCCCCCCLHTVGSVIGALTAKAPKPPENPVPTATAGGSAVKEPVYKVTKEYWLTCMLLTLFGFPLYIFITSDFKFPEGSIGEWAIVYALIFPGLQLLASIVVAIRNAGSKRPGKEQRLSHLGSITARAFVGGLLGILVMTVIFAAMD